MGKTTSRKNGTSRGSLSLDKTAGTPVGNIKGATRVEKSAGLTAEQIARKEKIAEATAMIDRSIIRNYKHQRIIITTAVQGAKVNNPFLASMETYIKHWGAELLILTTRAQTKPLAELEYPIDELLVERHGESLSKSIEINRFLSAIDIDIKPHTKDPLSGLQDLGADVGRSYIFAHTTQRMKTYPNGLKKYPRIQWCTGAVTDPLYRDNKAGLLGDKRHLIGALIVEVRDDMFLIRNVQADTDGSFIDITGGGMAKRYKPDGKIEHNIRADALIRGDEHGGPEAYGDPEANAALDELTRKLQPKNVVLHDLMDSASVSHHREGNISATLGVKAAINTLEKELAVTKRHVEKVKAAMLPDAQLMIISSNHNDHLHQYLDNPKRWPLDKTNYLKALELANVYHNLGMDPLKYAIDPTGELARWVGEDEEVRLGDNVQVGSHGHKGIGGARGTVQSDAVAFGKSSSGHSHSPAIFLGATKCGTSSLLSMGYNAGPSSWAFASEVLYKGGRQLVFIVNGLWRLTDKELAKNTRLEGSKKKKKEGGNALLKATVRTKKPAPIINKKKPTAKKKAPTKATVKKKTKSKK